MYVRLILEHGGHTLSKRVELPAAPAAGAIVLADRERRVARVEPHPDRGEADVYLCEDQDDLRLYTSALLHLAYINMVKGEGWEIEREEDLRAWLRERISRPGDLGPIGQN